MPFYWAISLFRKGGPCSYSSITTYHDSTHVSHPQSTFTHVLYIVRMVHVHTYMIGKTHSSSFPLATPTFKLPRAPFPRSNLYDQKSIYLWLANTNTTIYNNNSIQLRLLEGGRERKKREGLLKSKLRFSIFWGFWFGN